MLSDTSNIFQSTTKKESFWEKPDKKIKENIR